MGKVLGDRARNLWGLHKLQLVSALSEIIRHPVGVHRDLPGVENTTHLVSKILCGASLVVQWLRIHLPMQGMQVRSPVWEEPTYLGAAKPTPHSYQGCGLEPGTTPAETQDLWSPGSAAGEAAVNKPAHGHQSSACLLQLEEVTQQ